ncbi:MAG TPA: hypothetical protein PKK43_11325, partial [Spirochaetota bacterium]|nr:hypothetical protein [Spirochaetota bacterium]
MRKTISSLILFALFAVPVFSQDLSKKIVLKNLEPKDDNASSVTDKFNAALKSKLIEVMGDKYQIIDMDDIRSLKGKESLAEKKGNDPATMKTIADAVNAEEIIGGTISRESDRIRINAQSIQRSGAVKMTVNELFTDTELLDDYYLGEIVKKISNPKYVIKRVSNAGAKEIASLQKFQPGTGVSEKIS